MIDTNKRGVSMMAIRLYPYIAGFALGAILTVIVAVWGVATTGYQITLIVLYSGLLLAVARPKKKTYDSDNNTNNDPSINKE